MSEFYTSISQSGNNILYRGYRNGHPVREKVKLKPTLYVPSKHGEFVSLFGEKLGAVEFNTIWDAREWINEMKNLNQTPHGTSNFKAQFVYEKFPEEPLGDFKHIRIASLDIETTANDGFPDVQMTHDEITSIGCHHSTQNVMYQWTTAPYDQSKFKMKDAYKLDFRHFDNEIDLLKDFIAWWSDPVNTPDVITGWNTRGFDIPYLMNRVYKVLGHSDNKICNKFSPWGEAIRETQFVVRGRRNNTYEIPGIESIDYMDLFMKFGVLTYGPQESFSLDHIAKVVLGTEKEKYDGTLDELYKNDPQLFIDYNFKDVDIIVCFEKEMQLIALAFSIAYKAGVNPSETMGTTNVWESIIYRFCMSNDIVVPPKYRKSKTPYPGGYVKEPIPGFKKWVVSFDLASLYPHLILQYNMSPETFIDHIDPRITVQEVMGGVIPKDIVNGDVSITANGVMFDNSKRGVMPQIIEKLYDERKAAKKVMLGASNKLEKKGLSESERHKLTIERVVNNNRQMAVKILMNSLYGAMGNQYFTYFNQNIAESITLSGQLSIMVAEKAINNYMNKILNTDNKDYVIAIDTDSNYVDFEPLVKRVFKGRMDETDNIVKFLDKVSSEKFEPMIEQAYKDLANKMNAYDQKMIMERESIADVGIWVGKKRYILRVHNNEGVQYTEPKIKIMGVEAVKSSTPQICRDKFKDAFKIILDQDQSKLHTFIADFKSTWNQLEPYEVSFPRSVSDIDKWVGVDKGVPIHVRASISYNKLLVDNNLLKKFEKIKNGNKIKFSYCKTPNPSRGNVIAFQNDTLPKEINMHKYIDYDMQFQKSFLDPLELVLHSINWTSSPVASLEALF